MGKKVMTNPGEVRVGIVGMGIGRPNGRAKSPLARAAGKSGSPALPHRSEIMHAHHAVRVRRTKISALADRVFPWGLGAVLLAGILIWIRRPGDFAGYLTVGELALTGQHIYHDSPAGVNTWPPFFSLPCMVLALLARPTPYLARGFWLLLNVFLLWTILKMLAKLVYGSTLRLRQAGKSGLTLRSPEIFLPLLLCYRFILGNFDHLQINIAIFACTLAGLYWGAQARPVLGGVAIGFAAAVKVMPVLFLPYLWYRRRYALAISASVATFVFSFVPVLVYGWTRFIDYVHAWRAAVQAGWGVAKMNQSVFAMFDRLLGHGITVFNASPTNTLPASGHPAAIVATAGLLAAVTLVALWTFRGRPPLAAPVSLMEYSVVFIVAALFGPVTWKAYLIVLLLPLTLLVRLVRRRLLDRHQRRMIIGVLAVYFVLAGLTTPGLLGGHLAGTLAMLSDCTLAALVLLAALLWLRARGNFPRHAKLLQRKTLHGVMAAVALAPLAAGAVLPVSAAQPNLLENAGFEDGSGELPAQWSAWGSGSVGWRTGKAYRGRKFVSIDGGADGHLLYQWGGDAAPGKLYEAVVWVRSASGNAGGGIKIEFIDAGGEKKQHWYGILATESWQRLTFLQVSSPGARRAALTLCANAGSTLWYDEVSLKGERPELIRNIEFDLQHLAQRVEGFGVHHWAGQVNAAEEFRNLHITHIRITKDWSSWESMRALRETTDALGIKWLYVKWVPPKRFMGPDNQLADVDGYAHDWVETVRELDREGCRPHFIDLVNEPDYFGIPPAPYTALVKKVRGELNRAGYRDVQIVGPGLTHIGAGNFARYLDALDNAAVSSLGVWATHAWEDRWDDWSGSVAITDLRATDFVARCRERDAEKPIWYTEYATRQIRFHGVKYPHPDYESDNYCASFTMPYAMRVFENTLSILNHGANIPFYWCSGDYPGSKKQWGYIGPQGEHKPVYHALRALYGNIRPGTRVVRPPAEMSRHRVYAAAFLDDGQPQGSTVIVAMVNTSAERRKTTIRLDNAPAGLELVKAERVEVRSWGDAETKTADRVQVTPDTVRLRRKRGGYEMAVALPRDSALVVVLRSEK